MRQLLLLVSALALAYLSIMAYFSIRMVDSFDASDPTDFAPDIFTNWTIDYSDPSLPVTTFLGVNDLGDRLKVTHTYNVDAHIGMGLDYREWRGGLLMGDKVSLESWKEQPGEMAHRWRSEEGVNSRLFKTDEGFVLEKSTSEIVVWEDELRIPKFIVERGGFEFENDSSELGLKYDAVVNASEGRFLAVDLGDRYAWVFDDAKVETPEVEVHQEQREVTGLLGVIRNHRTRQDMDIHYDAEKSVVEAVGEDGGVVWSKEVEGAPIGQAFEVDIYANGKYQTAFATPQQVFLIDVKGNSVKGYPYKSSSPITGFSVVDYDKNRKFRFLVATANGKVANLKGEAKRTSGWSFTKLKDGIFVAHMHHLRVGSRDYIYAGCSDSSVLLLKRAGGVRTSTDVRVHSGAAPAFRLSSSIGKSSVLFVDSKGWLKELTFGDNIEVGMSGMVKADRVEVIDTNSDGKKEVVVYYKGKRTVWNSRNEQLDS